MKGLSKENRSFIRRLALSGSLAFAAAMGAFAWLLGENQSSEKLERPDVHFEHSDVNAKRVTLTGAGLIITVWIIIGLLYFVFQYFAKLRAQESPPPSPLATRAVLLPPEPRLQQSPARDFRKFRDEIDLELHSYKWLDRKNGIVAIPIDRAMDLVVERGIPPTKPAPPNMYFEPRAGSPLTGFEGKVEPEPR